MQIYNIEQTPSFEARLKLKNIDAQFDKMAKDLGCDKSLLVGSTSMGALSGSAASLASANYSGLDKVLPINVSIPVISTATSTAGYKSLVNNARKTTAKNIKNAKRRGIEVTENTTDADFIKPITKNLINRMKELFNLTKKETTKGN